MKRLTRSNEKLVSGVIGGIAEYLNPELDPVFFRLAFALLCFFNPGLILVYIGMALIVPAPQIQRVNKEVLS